MKEAVISLSSVILTIQGDGDYNKAADLINQYGVIDAKLRADLDQVNEKDIPVDIVFEQGREILGL